jgi:hypothetical protein
MAATKTTGEVADGVEQSSDRRMQDTHLRVKSRRELLYKS